MLLRHSLWTFECCDACKHFFLFSLFDKEKTCIPIVISHNGTDALSPDGFGLPLWQQTRGQFGFNDLPVCAALKATGLLSCLQMKIVSFRMKLKWMQHLREVQLEIPRRSPLSAELNDASAWRIGVRVAQFVVTLSHNDSSCCSIQNKTSSRRHWEGKTCSRCFA